MQAENKCCKNHNSFGDKNGADEENNFPVSLLESVNNIVKKEGFVTYTIDKKMISTNGGNYLGTLYEANIKGRTVEGEKEINIFFKHIIPGDRNQIFSVNEAYLKESYTYTELAKIFTEIQDAANVPIEERLNMAKSYDGTNSEAIILENLAKKGFTTPNRMDVVSLKYAELSIEQLAKFHGLTMTLHKKRPDYVENKLKHFKSFFYFNDVWRTYIKNLVAQSSKSLNNEDKKKVQDFLPKFYEKYQIYSENSSLPGCCLCHGDYRSNNILMQEIDGEIIKVVPVDYQLIYYGCPINDFMYFIFTGKDQKFRRAHLDHLKNLYYVTLDNFLKYFDVDIKEIYPRTEFERQFKERLDFGLMISLQLLPFLFTHEGEEPDFGKEDLTRLNFVFDSRCHERIQGAIDDFVQWGYL